MPEATVRFRTRADPLTLRKLLSDPTFVAGHIPQVVGVERTSETTARWTVLIALGPIRRKSVYEGELVEATDSSVTFRAVGPEATIEGRVSFVPKRSGGSDAELTLSMKGSGPLKAVVDAYLARRVREDAERFAQGLEARVKKSPTRST